MDEVGDDGNRTSSLSLELAPNASIEHSHGEEPSPMIETTMTESVSMEWTDEKHSLYLRSMETSFVNDLYNSVDFLGSQSRNYNNTNIQTHKFKVLRRGCWEKIVYEGKKPLLSESVNKFCDQDILMNPWIGRLRSSKVQKVEEISPILDANQESTSDDRQSRLGCPNFCQNHLLSNDIEEVLDQNFVDDDTEGVKAMNDQGVPFSKESSGGEDVGENCDI